MDQVDSMSDAELRAGLLQHGYTVPVTASNRNVLKKKLKQLLTNNVTRPLRYTVVEPVVEPIKKQTVTRKTDFKLEVEVSLMSDAELHARLLEHGYSVPVTASNRNLLKKRLTDLLAHSNLPESIPEFNSIAEPIVPVTHTYLPTQHFVRKPTDFLTVSQVSSLTNAELRARLNQYGYRNMPVTATTRPVLERKLMSLLCNKPVNNRQNTDMWSPTQSSITSDNHVDQNRAKSNLAGLPNNPTTLSGPSNVSDDVTILNKPSTSTGTGVKSSNTPGHLNSIQTTFSLPSSLHTDSDTTSTSSPYNNPELRMDVSSTATNNAEKDLIFSTDSSATTRNNYEEGLTPFLHPTKNIPLSSSKPKSPFVIDFMNRLSALTEEPPKAVSCYERKRNCLTPLQQKVLHSPCKIICTNK